MLQEFFQSFSQIARTIHFDFVISSKYQLLCLLRVAILCRTSGNMCKTLLFAFLWKETDRNKSSKDFGMLLFSLLQWLARQDIKPSAFWMAGWAIFQTEAFNILQPTQILILDDEELDLDCFTICYGLKVPPHHAQMTKHLDIVWVYLNVVKFICPLYLTDSTLPKTEAPSAQTIKWSMHSVLQNPGGC